MRSIIIIPVAILTIATAFNEINIQRKPWPVPDAAKNKKNPVPVSAESINAGKGLWSTHCKSCHGAKGLGDGPKADQLRTESGDFSKADVQSQTDGSIFYKISEGRDDMPGFKKKIPDQEDIWSLVNFIRTLKKGGATITPAKDTTTKKVEKPVEKPIVKPVVENPPVKKDTVVKKENIPVKTETLTVQEQLNRLGARMDSLEKQFRLMKANFDSIKISPGKN